MKRGRGPRRKKALKADPEKVREFQQRARRNRQERQLKRVEDFVAAEAARLERKRWGTRRRRDRLPGARTWTKRVFALYGNRCIVCGAPARQAHHVVPVNVILDDTRKAQEEREALAFDARQGAPVCIDCHDLHEKAARRIPWRCLRLQMIEWAEAFDYTGYIARTYAGAPSS